MRSCSPATAWRERKRNVLQRQLPDRLPRRDRVERQQRSQEEDAEWQEYDQREQEDGSRRSHILPRAQLDRMWTVAPPGACYEPFGPRREAAIGIHEGHGDSEQ